MADYSRIVPADIRLDRGPTDCAIRSWSELYLAVDTSGVSLYTKTCRDNDTPSIAAWHGRVLQYLIDSAYRDSVVVARDALAADLREGGRLAVLLERIHAGLKIKWNGKNHVGVLTTDARAADADLSAMLDRDDNYRARKTPSA